MVMVLSLQMAYSNPQFVSEESYCGINQETAEKTTAEMSQGPDEDIPEANGSEKKLMTCRGMVLLIFFIIQLGAIAALVILFWKLSIRPAVNSNEEDHIKLKELEENITAMGRAQAWLQTLLKESEDKIIAMGKNQTSLQILLKESENTITAMGRTQTSLQTLLKEAEEKLTVMTKNQSNLQIQLKQAELNIDIVKTKQSSLETKVSQAEQKIAALERNLSQIGLQGKCCPPGWDFLNPSCYYFATNAENWHSAQTHCKSLSSDLVVIKSAEEQEFIKQRKRHDWTYWIGLTDIEVERTWKWIDGSFCSSHSDGTVYWYEDQPNQQPFDEDCAVIYLDGSWHDFPCDNKFKWICERPIYTCFP